MRQQENIQNDLVCMHGNIQRNKSYACPESPCLREQDAESSNLS